MKRTHWQFTEAGELSFCGLRRQLMTRDEKAVTCARCHKMLRERLGTDALLTFKLITKLLGGHVHVDFWAGRGSRGRNGTLIFREEEWEEIQQILTRGDAFNQVSVETR